MEKSTWLFIIGVIIGLTVPGAEKVENLHEIIKEPAGYITAIYVAGAKLWQLAFSIMMLISLPVVVFKQISSRLSKRQFLPFPFMTGNSFGFTFVTVLNLFI